MDQPATAVEKYYTDRQHHIETGRRWDGPLHFKVINSMWIEQGLQPLPADFPCSEVIPESPERARSIRMEDRDAKREAETARAEMNSKIAAQSDNAQRLSQQETRIAELTAQIAELTGKNRPERELPPPPAPKATPGPAVDGRPTDEWTKAMIANWGKDQGLDLSANYIQKASKTELLNKVLTDTAPVVAAPEGS